MVIELKKPGVPARAAFDENLTHGRERFGTSPRPSPFEAERENCIVELTVLRHSNFALPRVVFFAQKVLRKVAGNWTFVVVTDRVELDDQIAKTYKTTSAVSEAEGDQCHAASGAHSRELLRGNHRYVFTLIHKFRPESSSDGRSRGDETHSSPVESQSLLTSSPTRTEVIVLTDDAHRSQYDTLALNIRVLRF